ncbi:MAG: hypothetical protein JW873_06410 [Candidatus Saganbacteria bacterium]|nr:hypothetical protein [Candidatus Saganbacteria bacterium]
MNVERTPRVSLLPNLRTVQGIPDAVANYKMTALPHFYSLGRHQGSRFMLAAGLAWLGGVFCLATGISFYTIARVAGMRLEKASVNALARLVKGEEDKQMIRTSMAESPLRPRLEYLLEKKGVVI